MKILGARVIEVTDGLQTLKEAVDAAFAAYCNEYKGRYLLHRFRCRPLSLPDDGARFPERCGH